MALFFACLPKTLAVHAFFASIVLFFIAVSAGAFLFYKYYISVQVEASLGEETIKFNEENYEKVLAERKAREKKNKETEQKQYSNPFEKPAPIVVPEKPAEEAQGENAEENLTQ